MMRARPSGSDAYRIYLHPLSKARAYFSNPFPICVCHICSIRVCRLVSLLLLTLVHTRGLLSASARGRQTHLLSAAVLVDSLFLLLPALNFLAIPLSFSFLAARPRELLSLHLSVSFVSPLVYLWLSLHLLPTPLLLLCWGMSCDCNPCDCFIFALVYSSCP